MVRRRDDPVAEADDALGTVRAAAHDRPRPPRASRCRLRGGLEGTPAKFRPTQSAPTTRGTSTGSYRFALSLRRTHLRSMDSVDVPLPVEPPPTTTGTPARGRIKTRRTTRSCPACSAAGCSTTRGDRAQVPALRRIVNGGHARCMGVSVIPEVTRPGTVPCVMDRRA